MADQDVDSGLQYGIIGRRGSEGIEDVDCVGIVCEDRNAFPHGRR